MTVIHRNKSRRFTVIHGQARRKNYKKIILFLLMLTALAFGLRAAGAFVYAKITARLVSTVIAEAGVVENVLAVRGLIVRNEHPVPAPITGKLDWLANNGQRVPKDAPIARITAGDGTVQTVLAPASGIAVLQLDGMEGMLQPHALDGVKVAQLLSLTVKESRFEQGETITRGSMFFKVVNNFSWVYIFRLDAPAAGVPDTSRQAIRFSFASDREFAGSMIFRREEDGAVTLAYEFSDDADGFLWQRIAEAEIVTEKVRGVILPLSALVGRGEETGVFTLEKSVVRFRTVKVLGTSSDRMVVNGLPTGLRVITNSNLVKEGQRF
ncbi:MAG: hypothetical protein KGZ79_14945 [Dethiobacter sp.]|jgi:putative membrane fusion protein|nr:hypothetical protein [Dethiobacter sp.]